MTTEKGTGEARCHTPLRQPAGARKEPGDKGLKPRPAISGEGDQNESAKPVTNAVPSVLLPPALALSAMKTEVFDATPGASV